MGRWYRSRNRERDLSPEYWEPRIKITFAKDGSVLYNGRRRHPVYQNPLGQPGPSAQEIIEREANLDD